MTDPADTLRVFHRRRARRLAVWNGAVWAVGNGLASTTLVVYLALELDAPRIGLGIGAILAMRYVVGALQLGAPAAIGRWAGRKGFCLAGFTLSGLTLLLLPAVAAPGLLPTPAASLAALVALWCLHHLMQYLAMVAFWSWLAELVRGRVRGRFLGVRGRWLAAGEAAGALAAGLHAWGWAGLHPDRPGWIAYVPPALCGAVLILASVLPVARMPAVRRRTAAARLPLGTLLAPWRDARFLGLLAFGSWLSAANGLTQSAQNIFPVRVLGVGLLLNLGVQTFMRLGQMGISPEMGRLADRRGNRAVMAGALLVVAAGPLFYLAASPERWWWFLGAWVVWIAYAGLNVCLPNLLLHTAPRSADTPHIAAYYAVTGLVYAGSTMLGGSLFDALREASFTLALPGGASLDHYGLLFLAGWLLRSLSVVLLLVLVREPAERRRAL
jgi:MFS family permease